MKNLYLLLLLMILFVSCNKDDLKPTTVIDKTIVELKYDGQHQFIITQGSESIDASSLIWTSSDETVGTVSSLGLFVANRIGTTTIKAKGTGINVTSEIFITPYNTIYKEPVLDFGETLAYIKSKESRTLNNEASDGLLYSGENSKVRNVMYLFEGSLLKSSIVLLANTDAVSTESVSFLMERYTYLDESDGIYIFTNNKVAAGLSYNDNLGLNIIYIKNTSTFTSIVALKKAFRNQISGVKMKQIRLN
ncbi:Ig-like domain-containing protein [Arcticibacter eurypsychrophilus]|uniref:Ig-like domain-containing protein n=1 Tax=Arcticibacter eurypsychrophilus TaxID=1434752 RepID=UPI0009F5125F|nr:Ig-like domain-containing protein [Arcticibacter eurypsychrophilus]